MENKGVVNNNIDHQMIAKELTWNELKLNWKLIKSELKLN
jgi:hypothetical protein